LGATLLLPGRSGNATFPQQPVLLLILQRLQVRFVQRCERFVAVEENVTLVTSNLQDGSSLTSDLRAALAPECAQPHAIIRSEF